MKKQVTGCVMLLLACLLQAEEPKRLSLTPAAGMTRADLHYAGRVRNPPAVLVLAPGCNGNGESLVSDPHWQTFARKHELGTVGISFASELNDLSNGTGYYYATNGSGRLLIDGVDTLFSGQPPLLLYGFSGGAHFTSRFAEWAPKRVMAWCAYSAGWWDEAKPSDVTPPGIVACGEDDGRLGYSLTYFKQGRALGRPWLWIGVPKSGHRPEGSVESFVQDYFTTILETRHAPESARQGIWVDIDKRIIAEPDFVRQYPAVTAWLPDARLLRAWQAITGP